MALISIRTVLIGVIVLTACVWLYARFMPAFKEGSIKSEMDLEQELLREPRETYYKKEAALRTSRNELLDISSGVAIASLTVLFFAFRKRIHTVAQLRQLRTLGKLQFFIWFNVGWIALFGALHWYYLYRGARGDYPPFADSIGIPMYYGQAALLVCWPVLNMLLLLAIWPAKMGGYLFEKPLIYTWWVLLIEVFNGIWLVLAAFYLLISILDGDHLTVPVTMLFLYLLLVLRAGHIEAVNARINRLRLFEKQ